MTTTHEVQKPSPYILRAPKFETLSAIVDAVEFLCKEQACSTNIVRLVQIAYPEAKSGTITVALTHLWRAGVLKREDRVSIGSGRIYFLYWKGDVALDEAIFLSTLELEHTKAEKLKSKVAPPAVETEPTLFPTMARMIYEAVCDAQGFKSSEVVSLVHQDFPRMHAPSITSMLPSLAIAGVLRRDDDGRYWKGDVEWPKGKRLGQVEREERDRKEKEAQLALEGKTLARRVYEAVVSGAGRNSKEIATLLRVRENSVSNALTDLFAVDHLDRMVGCRPFRYSPGSVKWEEGAALRHLTGPLTGRKHRKPAPEPAVIKPTPPAMSVISRPSQVESEKAFHKLMDEFEPTKFDPTEEPPVTSIAALPPSAYFMSGNVALTPSNVEPIRPKKSIGRRVLESILPWMRKAA